MIELSIIINRIKVTFISNQTHTFSPLFKIDANYSVYSFKEFMKDKVNESSVHGVSASFGQLEYRESLAMSLMGLDLNRQLAPSPKPSVDQCLPMISENRRDCICCNGEASMLGQKVPSTKTHYYCSKCEVPLCLQRERNCFLKWHSPEGKVIQDWARTKGRKRKL